ncbi:MAG: polysaccharide biosynthesis protein [Devosiaceae bacterium]|nr:polysaccharide biosynthesis protein [Devosiaceae bacterium]
MKLPRFLKRVILMGFDFVVLIFAVWAAYSLRLNTLVIPDFTQTLVMILAPLTAIPVFIRFGLYRSIIRYLPDRAFWTIANAVLIATLLWVGTLFALEISRVGVVPRSLPLIYGILAILIIGGSRFLAKLLLWTPVKNSISGQVLIYGAGAAGAQLADALHEQGKKYVAGFLDDDIALHGRDIGGIRVYPPAHLNRLIDTMGIKEVILSMPSISSAKRQKIISELSYHKIKIRALPALTDLASGRYLISQVREIDINDILGRSSIPADPELLQKMIEGRSILVSGAGGSIGSELCKLIINWNPRKLMLLEANEFALYQLERKLKMHSDLPIVPVLGSVTDSALVARVFRQEAVQVVFHAAAHKHVPLVEANVLEGVRNNIFGTQNIAKLAFEAEVENFVLISTDKAVRPTNIMGATKRWAELIVRSFADQAQAQQSGQKFCAVRFGNVLGSNGSVVPLFKEQISRGGPLTITDERMTRYFMSIHEAAELIVQAGALSKGGDIFILEMGEPVRIRDLAQNMIRLAGLSIQNNENPGGDIAITTIGARPGEKIHEELFYDPKNAKPTRRPKILRAPQKQRSNINIEDELQHLHEFYRNQDEPNVRKLLFALINDETRQNKVISLDVVPKSSTS